MYNRSSRRNQPIGNFSFIRNNQIVHYNTFIL
uniref:Uncharacterized protein n=1 Tax=Lotus japonicus TaxID=34305 RepID=I3SQP1_LOTJA|nr:unknown [Lotus japonicus]